MLELSNSTLNHDGSTALIDNNDRLINIKNGIRNTAYQDSIYKNNIFFFGTCTYIGIGVPFDKTIESYLQLIINKNNDSFRVWNYGQFYASRYQDIFYNMHKINYKKGDIIFVCLQNLRPISFDYLDFNKLFLNDNDLQFFVDFGHMFETANPRIAEYIYRFLQCNNFFSNFFQDKQVHPFHVYGIPDKLLCYHNNIFYLDNIDTLNIFKNSLLKHRRRIGSIVMNCNPFTLGHKYLIERALNSVDFLYIFVVEEDKSYFKFIERLAFVKAETKNYKNIDVLPSGEFIISQKTFDGYFNKENIQDELVDTSLDIDLFGSEIAPVLGINIRFVGEEPFDKITNQYNQKMKQLLPKYNIELSEIPRKQLDNEFISATKVRKLIKEDNIEEIKKFVPNSVFTFISKNKEMLQERERERESKESLPQKDD